METRVCLDQWKAFNPQVIFGNTNDKKTGEAIFQRPGWESVDGVKQGKIYYFPWELTTRAACNTGQFVQWLASFIYSDLLFVPETQVRPDTMLGAEPVAIDLGIVKKSERIKLCLADFTHKTLVVDFNSPRPFFPPWKVSSTTSLPLPTTIFPRPPGPCPTPQALAEPKTKSSPSLDAIPKPPPC